jgi:proteasome lid subunit RPN8/RPN11
MEIFNIENAVINETNKTPDAECCGVIYIKHYIKNFPVFDIIPFTNLATKSSNGFEMDIEKFNLIYKIKKIYCIYHSHVIKNSNENFSEQDINLSEAWKIPIMVYCPVTQKFNWYKPFSLQTNYLNRSFLVGVGDCYSLIRDYYYKELNIKIPDIYRSYTFIKEYDLSNEIKNFGFVEISESEIQKNDVIIIDKPSLQGKYTFLIYLGNNKILGHSENISQMEYYSKYSKYNRKIIRYAKIS